MGEWMIGLIGVAQWALAGWFFYLSFLLYKFLKTDSNKHKRIVFFSDNKGIPFMKDENNAFAVNALCVQIFFVKEKTVFVELMNGDIYRICKCKNDEEAQNHMNKILENINSG